jgi:hypothetical protein
MAALFVAVDATTQRWRAFNTGGQELTGALLRGISDTNFVIHLQRPKRAAAEPEAGSAATPTRRARTGYESDGAGGAGQEDDMLDEPYQAEKWQAPPTYRLLDGLGEGFPRYNAVLELIDNGVRALVLRARRDGAATPPLELCVMLWSTLNLKWCLSVRDTGIGMPASHVPIWATLGGDDGSKRPDECGNPCHPDGACITRRRTALPERGRMLFPGSCAPTRC